MREKTSALDELVNREDDKWICERCGYEATSDYCKNYRLPFPPRRENTAAAELARLKKTSIDNNILEIRSLARNLLIGWGDCIPRDVRRGLEQIEKLTIAT
jgi:hypothetical protein